MLLREGSRHRYLRKSRDDGQVVAGASPDEQQRREKFSKELAKKLDEFRGLGLSKVRNITLHRSGVAPIELKVDGRWGVTYVGTPAMRISATETRDPGPPLPMQAPPVPIEIHWDDFKVSGKPMFPACQEYLAGAGELVAAAKAVCQAVHGSGALTPPPG